MSSVEKSCEKSCEKNPCHPCHPWKKKLCPKKIRVIRVIRGKKVVSKKNPCHLCHPWKKKLWKDLLRRLFIENKTNRISTKQASNPVVKLLRV